MEKFNKLFSDQSGDVPQELLLRYVRGEVTSEERRFVESRLADDPFLSDAVEGLMTTGDLKKVAQHLSEVNEKIRERSAGKGRIISFSAKRILQIAAAVTVLIISGWLINLMLTKSTQKIFTEEFKPYPAPSSEQIPETPGDATSIPPQQQPGEIEASKPKAVPPVAGTKKQAAPVEKSEEIKKEMKDQPAFTETEEAPSSSYADRDDKVETMNEVNTVAGEQAKPQTDSVQFNAPTPVTSQSLKKPQVIQPSASRAVTDQLADAEKVQDAQNKFLNDGLSYYHAGQYQNAIVQFELLLEEDPGNPAANFYSAVSYLAMDNADEALKKLKKLDNNKDGQYYEATLWYESLAYVKNGEKKNAINTLEKIEKLNGEYQSKAEQLLKELK